MKVHARFCLLLMAFITVFSLQAQFTIKEKIYTERQPRKITADHYPPFARIVTVYGLDAAGRQAGLSLTRTDHGNPPS